MIAGDQIYINNRLQTERNLATHPIQNNRYLLLRNINVELVIFKYQDDLVIFHKRIQINFDEEPNIFGSLRAN